MSASTSDEITQLRTALRGSEDEAATSPGGETWTVRGPDYYAAVFELAGQVGVELEDR